MLSFFSHIIVLNEKNRTVRLNDFGTDCSITFSRAGNTTYVIYHIAEYIFLAE